MLKVSAVMPVYHTTEDGRWDYRVTIVYKNAAVAHDNFDSAALIKQMYPDQETYKKEEQRRFEILEGQLDLPVKDADLEEKKNFKKKKNPSTTKHGIFKKRRGNRRWP